MTKDGFSLSMVTDSQYESLTKYLIQLYYSLCNHKQVLITYKTRAHAQLSVTLLPQALTQSFRHI